MVLAVPALAGGQALGLDLEAALQVTLRDSRALELELQGITDIPPHLLPVVLGTPAPGTHLELANLELTLDARLGEHLTGRARVHVLDLQYRNPTPLSSRVFVRELWVGRGSPPPVLSGLEPGAWYVLAGHAARFTRQPLRQLESYGLWGTTLNLFELPQVQAGGSLRGGWYWRTHVGLAPPLYMRDPNYLAGENGTAAALDPARAAPYGSGFPVLYDARRETFSLDGATEVGLGLGWRTVPAQRRVLDVLAWHVERDLSAEVELEGTRYHGDLDLLDIGDLALPLSGRRKQETGLNLVWRHERLLTYAQYVRQDVAGLERDGLEVEVMLHVPVPALFAAFDRPILTWIRPALRYSTLHNHFAAPAGFHAPTLAWDWQKLDLGVRLGIVREVELTLEYARNRLHLGDGRVLHPDELLAVVRVELPAYRSRSTP